MNSIIKYVQERFAKGGKVDCILHSGGRHITLFFYSNGYPIVVGKVSRLNHRVLRREYESLKLLEKIFSKCWLLNNTIPRALGFTKLDEKYVLFEEYKDGICGSVYLKTIHRRKNVKKVLHESVGWLINFLQHTKEYHNMSKTAKQRISALWGQCGNGSIPYYRKFLEEGFFLGPSHGDLVVSNILFGRVGKITGVIDFENFTMNGFPVTDLIDIIASTGSELFGFTKDMINKTFFELNSFSEEVRKCVEYFCRSCKLEVDDLISVLPVWSDKAIYQSRKIGDNALLKFHILLKKMLIKRVGEIVWKY